MSTLSIFDIAGPIMVGPSSSHTAGACKIGQFARALYHHTPTKVTFHLHGSFGEVYKGHATDRALLAGVMKFKTSDPNIAKSFELADKIGLKYEFIPKDLGADCHPNTVEVLLTNGKDKMSVWGRSIGGGMIEIIKIDNFDVLLHGSAGKCLSLVICHDDKDEIWQDLKKKIEQLPDTEVTSVEHSLYADKSLTVFGLEGRRITQNEVLELEKTPGIDFIRSLSKLQTQ